MTQREEEIDVLLEKWELRTRKALFGLSMMTLYFLWDTLYMPFASQGLSLEHLFWGLYFLRKYPTEDEAAAFWRTTRKTWREKVWTVLDILLATIRTVSSTSFFYKTKNIVRVYNIV